MGEKDEARKHFEGILSGNDRYGVLYLGIFFSLNKDLLIRRKTSGDQCAHEEGEVQSGGTPALLSHELCRTSTYASHFSLH